MYRKIVKPALDGGRIWNPEHGRFLPPEGLEVQMTPYWLDLEGRQDIVASAVPEPEADEESEIEAPEVEKPAAPQPAAPQVAAKPAAKTTPTV